MMIRLNHVSRYLGYAGLAVLVLTLTASARSLVPAEQRFSPYTGNVPACDSGLVLETISDRFGEREATFWHSGLSVTGFDRVMERGFRTNGLDYIPRRYCTARVFTNDNKVRYVTYSIGENLGIIGTGFGVDWCIDGLDRNHLYGASCKVARR